MKVLMLTIDNSILDTNSVSAERMKLYGTICDQLHIIVIGGNSKEIDVKISDNVFAYATNSNNKISSLFDALEMSGDILDEEGKWIITTQNPFELGCIAYYLSKKYNYKFEVQLHGDFYGNNFWIKERLINRFRFYLGKYIIKRANLVRVVSKRVFNSIKKLNKNIYIAPIYSDLPKIVKRETNRGITLLSIGNLAPVKNHKILIEAYNNLKKEFKDLKLIIVGEGYLKESLDISDGVILVGEQKNLEDYYERADIFVHPSMYEGWGRVVIEAASYGLPIVMADVGLAGEVIKNNESGLVVPVNNKDALVHAISKLLNNSVLRRELGKSAKKAVHELPDKKEILDIIKAKWLELVV